MIKISILILFATVVSVRGASTEDKSRQLAYPPYFHSVAYPVGYSWGIAALVLAVFKAVFVFSIVVIGTFFESGFTRHSAARENDPQKDRLMDLIDSFVSPHITRDCWREVRCEAESYMARNPFLRMLSSLGRAKESDCKRTTSTAGCKAITFEDVILGNFKSMYAKGTSLLNKFVRERFS